jgi:hypothetical protein
MALMAKAVLRLRPDLSKRISAGELTLEEAQTSMARAFHDLVMKTAKAEVAAKEAKGRRE